jgi:mannose-6-phosphate isomerase-like protein (cupin superfamily)
MKRSNFLKNSIVFSVLGTQKIEFDKSIKRPTKGIFVKAGDDRNQKSISIGNTILDCKVTGKDTDGNLYIFESKNNLKNEGPPLHSHPNLDETFYMLEGELKFKIGEEIKYLKLGDTLLVPRNVPHCFTSNSDKPAKFMVIIQSATTMEAFFQELSELKEITPEIGAKIYLKHNMTLLGPPIFAD